MTKLTEADEIRNMLALWSQYDADKDPDGFASIFTPDGTYMGKRGVSTGTAALRKNLADRNAANPPDRRTMHLFAEALIEINGDTATAIAPYVGFGRIGDQPWTIMSIGRFHTWLVKKDGKWLFTKVDNRSIGPAGGVATILHHPNVQNP